MTCGLSHKQQAESNKQQTNVSENTQRGKVAYTGNKTNRQNKTEGAREQEICMGQQ